METEDRDKPMRGITEALQNAVSNITLKSESSDECSLCFDTSWQNMGDGLGVQRCSCAIPRLIAGRLAKIPPRYQGATLETLEARGNHPKQVHVIKLMQANPTASFIFCGDFNSGKTHFLWSLYSEVAKNLNRRIVACSMLQLINEYRDAFRQRGEFEELPMVSVRPNDLMQSAIPYSLFFDDIDKPKMSDYVAEQIHALFDAAYIYNHQIVVTTNLMPDALTTYFERADERYGGAIVRRIIHDGNILVEMN